MSKLTELVEPRCKHRHTARTHPNCFHQDGSPLAEGEVPTRDVKVLIFDVETLPIVGYAWNVWQENIGMNQIIKDWCILSWSAKWLGSDKIMSDVLSPREAVKRDDKRLVTSFWTLLDSADIVVAHNGKRFDIKKVNTRFWKNKLDRPSSYKVIDTLNSVRSTFSLTFNKQDFVARFLGIQEKLDTDFELWADCDHGIPESLKYMVEYNEQDVRMLEEIYYELRGWIPNHPDLRLYTHDIDACPVCLSKSKHKNIGLFVAQSKKYKEYRCADCGSIWHDSKAIKE